MKIKTVVRTFDEDSRKVACDVLGHSKGVPRVNGTIGEDDASGSDVISSVFLIGLLNSIVQRGAEVIYVSALLQVIAEEREGKPEESSMQKNPKHLMQLQTNKPQDDRHTMTVKHTLTVREIH